MTGDFYYFRYLDVIWVIQITNFFDISVDYLIGYSSCPVKSRHLSLILHVDRTEQLHPKRIPHRRTLTTNMLLNFSATSAMQNK